MKWLLDIAAEVEKKQTHCADDNGRKIAVATVLVICCHKLSPCGLKLQYADRVLLLSLLRLKPNLEAHACHDFCYLKSFMNSATTVDDALCATQTLCTELAKEKHLSCPQWLYAIPLIHYLSKMCTPFQIMLLNPEQSKVWEDKSIPLDSVVKAIQLDPAAKLGKYK